MEWLCFQLNSFDIRQVFGFKSDCVIQNNEPIKKIRNQKGEARNQDTFAKVSRISLVMVGDALLDTGFTMVSLANNHTLNRRIR